ncbi:hypothetical protein FB567DRAFT_60254 [Paraphoma chrysanthemicola]|uniref:NACHT domain-containing protein n=1 Tax=Paraphoma chrysanthemicola TaxID=798071 RepID=A0A8K0VYG5_9PLEO|nr:hypothetical protein FB567DRAFT_60254 [Paraphoma chrysanthemicola]
MRLLLYDSSGSLTLSDVFADERKIPPYAILSHTWVEGEEVTYQDLIEGTGQGKSGRVKINHCGQQAQADGLRYFWVDTCCIDKSNKSEYQHAIKSMFRWYQNASRCYAYLADVPSLKRKAPQSVSDLEHSWLSSFRSSRWFTRGWTLQELLAPSILVFYDKDWKTLGNKADLRQQIHEITAIQETALQGVPVFEFSVNERLRWAQTRQTTVEEDKVYSLLGFFGIDLAPIYGIGYGEAFRHLRDEVTKTETCLRDLCITNPKDDKRRIEETKGGLLNDASSWILGTPEFIEWYSAANDPFLWIRGDPGKGKTMLMCTIVDHLVDKKGSTDILCYFFCQATDARLNSASAVLRGLLYMILEQQPSLTCHLLKKQKNAGRHAFEDANSWILLTDVLTSILKDPLLRTTYLLVDALDECATTDLPKLLDFVSEASSATWHVKWIVSSRNWPSIQHRLNDKRGLSLELNAKCIERGVVVFIQYKVAYLAKKNQYDEALKAAMLDYVLANSQNTFLWVALVVLNLEDVPRRHALRKLNAMPAGLNALYQRMLHQINYTDDAEVCRRILAIATTVFRPITILELEVLLSADPSVSTNELTELIGLCGSFLALREETIFFVHQSAADYILNVAKDAIYPSGRNGIHGVIVQQSIKALAVLHRDMYSLKHPGYRAEDVVTPDPDHLSKLRYAIVYWMDHLAEAQGSFMLGAELLSDGGGVFAFLQEKFIYWLESLSLCLSVPKGVLSITKLSKLVQNQGAGPKLRDLILDAKRFMMYHQYTITTYPLQTYASAILFSPTESLIRQFSRKELPSWVSVAREMDKSWTACVRVFEGLRVAVRSVHFSEDSSLLVAMNSTYLWTEVMIWDTVSGQPLQTLNLKRTLSSAVSADCHRLAVLFPDFRVEIWDTLKALLVSELRTTGLQLSQESRTNFIALSPDLSFVAASGNDTIVVWKTDMLDSLHTLRSQGSSIISMAFSEDNYRLCAVMKDGAMLRWDAHSGECLSALRGEHVGVVDAVLYGDEQCVYSTLSPSGIFLCDTQSGHLTKLSMDYTQIIAIDSKLTRCVSVTGQEVSILDVASGFRVRQFTCQTDDVVSVAFSHDSNYIAIGSHEGQIQMYDLTVREESQICQDYEVVNSMRWCWSPNGSHLVVIPPSDSGDLWDARTGQRHRFIHHDDEITWATFSQSQPVRLATGSRDQVIKLWDLSRHVCVLALTGHKSPISSIAFSADSNQLVTTSADAEVKIWNVHTGQCTRTFEHDLQRGGMAQAIFSNDSKRVLVASDGVGIWDVDTGLRHEEFPEVGRLYDTSDLKTAIALSHDNASLAMSQQIEITIWDLAQRKVTLDLDCNMPAADLAFDDTGLYLRSSFGTIDIAATIAQPQRGLGETKDPVYLGLSLDFREEMITYNSHLLLWIPAECRPSFFGFAVQNNAVAVLDKAGRLWMYTFDLDQIEALVSGTDSDIQGPRT